MSLDPNLAEAHMALSFLHLIADWDWTRAKEESARAVALDSTNADIWLFRGWSFVPTGQLHSAVAMMRHALTIDPTSLIIHTRVGTTRARVRRSQGPCGHDSRLSGAAPPLA